MGAAVLEASRRLSPRSSTSWDQRRSNIGEVQVPMLGSLFGTLPGAVATLANAIVLVSLMTWVVMPLLVRLFAQWLFAGRR